MKTPAIPLAKVHQSTSVKAAGYDAATQTLAVEFSGGGIYHYANVSPAQYAELNKAASFGSHLATQIKGKAKHPATHLNPKKKA